MILAKTITAKTACGQRITYSLDEQTKTYIPQLQPFPQKAVGKYGIMRMNYLKKYSKAMYRVLLTTGKLNEHLSEIDRTAHRRLEQMIPQMMMSQGVTEQLKSEDQIKWTGLMNNIRQAAEEIVQSELIYN
ncbi:MAG: TnpV protein [Oscillospiraceae bacterium]|nr:TnpV protein [Oscillospiraceae bacterium]